MALPLSLGKTNYRELLAEFHPVDVHEAATFLGVGQDEVDVMATSRRSELGLVLHELTPVARVGDVDRRDERSSRRVEADLDLAALGRDDEGFEAAIAVQDVEVEGKGDRGRRERLAEIGERRIGDDTMPLFEAEAME